MSSWYEAWADRYAEWSAGVTADVPFYVALAPGGVGQTQALDVATLRPFGSSSDIAAFSISQDSIITIWNVILGVVVLLWAFGLAGVKQMFSRDRTKTHAPAGA
jgi:hypothetical protein